MLTAIPNGPALTAGHQAGADARPVCRQRRFNHWVDEIYYEGGWEVGPLRDALTGHISTGGEQSACTFTFEGCGLILQFWSHPWSGVAAVEIDGVARTVDLFGDVPAMKNVHFDDLPAGIHVVRISGTRRTDGPHPGDQIVFHEAIVYDRQTEIVAKPAGQLVSAHKPARFNALYYAPGGLGWAERTLLFATVFGARPRNVLIVGKQQGGAALIVVAALDDLGLGAVTCVDPDPNISPDHWLKMGHRTTLVTAEEALAKARERSGSAFDFAFLDLSAMAPDWDALAAALHGGATILAHGGPTDFAVAHPEFCDGGVLVPQAEGSGGLRLLRRRSPV